MICLAVFSYLNFMSKFLFQMCVFCCLYGALLFFGKLKFTLDYNSMTSNCLFTNIGYFGIYHLDCRKYQYILSNLALPQSSGCLAYGGLGKLGSWYLLLLLSLVLVLKILGNRTQNGNWTLKNNDLKS